MSRHAPRALVTGAGGFIGGHLARRLHTEGYQVLAIDRKPPGEWEQDLPAKTRGLTWARDLPVRDIEWADEIYHLAADMGGVEFTSNERLAGCDNIVDTLHLAKYAREGQKFFFASTACVYPVELQHQPDALALREDMIWPYDPEPGYGFEKLFGEHALGWAAVERGVDVRVARYHNVYGPLGTWQGGREKAPAAICRKVAAAVLSRADHITIFGDGEQTRSFMYVDDCVEGTRRLTASDCPVPLNLGSDQLVSINTLAAVTADIAGAPWLRVAHQEGPQGVRGRNSDNTLIRAKLGWAPAISLHDGLEKTYAWIYDQVKRELKP